MELQTPSSSCRSRGTTTPISVSNGISIINNGSPSSNLDLLQIKPDLLPDLDNVNMGELFHAHDGPSFFDDADSTCSTPYVSAPSSPGRGPMGGFFYSAPASPMHFALTSVASAQHSSSSYEIGGNHTVPLGCEFEFSARLGSFGGSGSMSSADELFLNGQIRPMKLSTHLQRPQVLAPLLDLEVEEDDETQVDSQVRGRDMRLRNKSLRRRTRSMSPLRNTPFEWEENDDVHGGTHSKEESAKTDGTSEIEEGEGKREKLDGLGSETTTTSVSASSSRSSSAGRSSKRWVFLKDFLYRSKSEGRSNNKFWSNISFTPVKEKKPTNQNLANSGPKEKEKEKHTNQTASSSGSSDAQKSKANTRACPSKKTNAGKPTNGVGKRRGPPSPHELHYKANRAQAEELRRKTFLPYRPGLLGCLGFTSKGYGAMNGFARALNPVSSR